MTSGVPSLRPAHRCDGQRPVVLPWFVGTRTEERVDALVEDVVESVDVDFSVDIVERHLWRNTALFWKHKQEMAGGKKMKNTLVCFCDRTCPFSKSTNIPILLGLRLIWTSVEGSVRKAYLFLKKRRQEEKKQEERFSSVTAAAPGFTIKTKERSEGSWELSSSLCPIPAD